LYKFRKIVAAGFHIHAANPEVGAFLQKRFIIEGVTPGTQSTLNLYIAGSFSVECVAANLAHTFNAGDTSIGLGNIVFVKDAIITETSLIDGALRYCVEPIDRAAAWTRRVLSMPVGGVLDIVVGELVIVLRGEVASSAAQHAPGDLIVVSRAQSLTSTAGARLAILKLIPTTLPT